MSRRSTLFERMSAAIRSDAADRPPAHGVQLRRSKGCKLPVNTITVARPGPLGNPVKVGSTWDGVFVRDAAQAVELFEVGIAAADPRFPTREMIARLRGWNLACWCGLDQPCHRNVLLRIANPPPTSPAIAHSELNKGRRDTDGA